MMPQLGADEVESTREAVLTHTDALTGLGNRRRMREKVEGLAAERAEDPAPFTIGLANLDGFKPINDLFGHGAGDVILTQVAHRLKACMPDGATVVRLGNDEFGFVLPLVFDSRGAEKMARLIKDVLSAPFDLGARTVRLTASFGFSVYPFAGTDFDSLMSCAETALYRSKRRGRSQITVYSQEIAEEFRRATELEQALRRAIIADDVAVHFQPIVRLADGQIMGFEALARWHDAELGFVPPNVFITLAEERGFIDLLTEVLLKKAAATALRWPEDMYLSFNLSSAQLVDPMTSLSILAILNRAGLDPRRLELEITETAMMSDPDMAQKIVTELRAVGIKIALDDFGTGQSSLGRLRDFTFDKVKIDRAFVSEITRDRPSEHIIKAILAMCEGMDLAVIAEGIEEVEQAAKLIQLGCRLGQGYLYGKPIKASDTLRLIAANARPLEAIAIA
ncbi:EAL domain-containing protein [Georhizobium profundi]|jgi:diguanylate cyclase (GGDEF)-like protein|uniref:EAL domain-containing protein n=1 Tax=Georhizobium profundi TaxID=2341112 RepID=A0A3S9B880_9HYPH|nr:EAL domain-containing protein [Georhizobium profundi]GLQ38200.1 GGDEF-domain containing protein [Rhizobium albus]